MTNPETHDLTDEQLKVLQDIRDAGYALVLFSPEELGGANINKVEYLMTEAAWEYIKWSPA